ncbi:hypothetical protein M231_07821 [Tremella mesenterica]|uniref:DNA recombination and repair protein Rad51-like C-terminal domain-containing protein n=1 Tax=Tremella mesenterica TaxID=5217 RepID=A0A4Q1BB44_TREME|nr:hypothetical protein M231_07821 [Tremella mesenterica]
MTRLSLHLPLSALLPPKDDPHSVPLNPLPSPAIIIGPLPPTSPLHLSLQYLALSDIPDFHRPSRHRERVLILTGSKDTFRHALEEEDEDWFRDHGADYDVLYRLRRVDMRFCPSPQQLMMMLVLLSVGEGTEPHKVSQQPGMIILWDIAGMFMEEIGGDENEPQTCHPEHEQRFRSEACISDYLSLLSAARTTISQMSSPDISSIRLIILEPHLSATSAMPIFPVRPTDENDPMPRATRERRVMVMEGLTKLFGRQAIGQVNSLSSESDLRDGSSYSLNLDMYPGEIFQMRRRRCGRAEWAGATVVGPDEGVDGDLGGWRWGFV